MRVQKHVPSKQIVFIKKKFMHGYTYTIRPWMLKPLKAGFI